MRLARKLQPDSARGTLLRAAALLVGWELVQSEVVNKVRDFFTFGFDQFGPRVDRRYQERVVSRSARIFDASLGWLMETNAVTAEEAASLKDLRDYRNLVAHELGAFLIDPDREIDLAKLEAIRGVLASLGRFWGQIEVDTNPDFDGRDVDPQDIVSGSTMLLEFALSVLPSEAR